MPKPKGKVFYEGTYHAVELAVRCDGSCPAQEFLDGLSRKELAGIARIIKRLADFGKITNREQFKQIEPGFNEFKYFQIRMPCYFKPGRRVVITHGFRKKADKISRAEIDRMKRIKAEYEKED